MVTLFSLGVFAEPDLQLFARFAIEAVKKLGGSDFAVTMHMNGLLKKFREIYRQEEGVSNIFLSIEENMLFAECCGQRMLLTKLPQIPSTKAISAITEQLKNASEINDPEVLKIHNQVISDQLANAKRRAAKEMAELEDMLKKEKFELKKSIILAETDSLTGLYNRGAYDKLLQDTLYRCSRQGFPMSLIILDVDNFKGINDSHGHQYGDKYLQSMADAMKKAARENVDYVCRIGGDEFAIIVFSHMEIAYRIAEKVLELFDEKVSIGLAPLEPEDTAESLAAKADAALYRAKELGRGRVIRSISLKETTGELKEKS